MNDDTPADVAAARALAAAYDALNSPEHKQEAETLRELSLKVTARIDALNAARASLHSVNEQQVETGEAEPAPNIEAAQTIAGKGWVHQFLNGDHPSMSGDPLVFDMPEEATARANGAYSED